MEQLPASSWGIYLFIVCVSLLVSFVIFYTLFEIKLLEIKIEIGIDLPVQSSGRNKFNGFQLL